MQASPEVQSFERDPLTLICITVIGNYLCVPACEGMTAGSLHELLRDELIRTSMARRLIVQQRMMHIWRLRSRRTKDLHS